MFPPEVCGVPVVVNTLHGFYFDDGTKPLPRRFYIWMERIAAKCSDTILSQNKEDIETGTRAAAAGGFSSVPNGCGGVGERLVVSHTLGVATGNSGSGSTAGANMARRSTVPLMLMSSM